MSLFSHAIDYLQGGPLATTSAREEISATKETHAKLARQGYQGQQLGLHDKLLVFCDIKRHQHEKYIIKEIVAT